MEQKKKQVTTIGGKENDEFVYGVSISQEMEDYPTTDIQRGFIKVEGFMVQNHKQILYQESPHCKVMFYQEIDSTIDFGDKGLESRQSSNL